MRVGREERGHKYEVQSKGEGALAGRRTKEAKVALFPYSWIGLFWKEFPFPPIIPNFLF